ncbi:MAG: putative Ig domain-containing protein [Planctomycetota bacterium]
MSAIKRIGIIALLIGITSLTIGIKGCPVDDNAGLITGSSGIHGQGKFNNQKLVLDKVSDAPDPFFPALGESVLTGEFRVKYTDGLGSQAEAQKEMFKYFIRHAWEFSDYTTGEKVNQFINEQEIFPPPRANEEDDEDVYFPLTVTRTWNGTDAQGTLVKDGVYQYTLIGELIRKKVDKESNGNADNKGDKDDKIDNQSNGKDDDKDDKNKGKPDNKNVDNNGQGNDDKEHQVKIIGVSLPMTGTITVSSNRAPVLNAIGNKNVDENVNLAFTLVANDPDGDTINYSMTGGPTGATLDSATGAFSWTPSYDQAGSYPVTFTVTDNGIPAPLSDEETVTITVNNVNRPPILTAVSDKSVDENVLLTFTLSATDPDGDALSYSATGLPNGAILEGDTFSWTPDYTQAGTYSNIKFRVTDPGLLYDEKVITILVNNINRSPTMTSPGNKIVNEGQLLTFTLSAADPDGDTIVYTMIGGPIGATLDSATGAFSWTPSYERSGSYPVTFTVTDNGAGNLSVSETVTITVNDVVVSTVGTEGGIVGVTTPESPIFGAAIIIPPGALTTTVVVMIQEPTPEIIDALTPIPVGFTNAGPLVDFVTSPELVFTKPVTIKVPYDEQKVLALGLSEEDVRLLRYDSTLNQWINVPIAFVDTVNNLVIAQVTSLSLYGVVNSPSGIAAGGSHTVILKTDGTLWAWGLNSSGQLGNGTFTNKNIPTKIGTDTNWAIIAAGGSHTVALKTDRTLWAWGRNDRGQLGDGTNTNRNIPTKIGTDTNWAGITAGEYHTVAIKTNGTLWAWGSNEYWQLGDGTTVDKNVPTQIGNDTNWSAIAAGGKHTVARKSDNTVWTWGNNNFGQLGNNIQNNTFKSTPTQIWGGNWYWSAIAAGWEHTAAIQTDGTLWAWGWNSDGQLGLGNTTSFNIPKQVGTLNTWRQVACGGVHTVALRTDYTLWAWGYNGGGQLGDGTNISKYLPTQIETGWAVIAAGGGHTVARKTNGTLWTWGYNFYGQLGDGTTTNRTTPTEPLSLPAQVTSPIPGNGATNIPITQQLSWASANGATSYDVYFGTTSPPAYKVNTTATSYNPGTLLNNTLYYWRIDSKNSVGIIPGNVWSFTTAPDTIPPTVISVSPANGSTGIAVSTNISVTFSEAMNQSATQGAFSTSPTVAGAFSWSGNIMTFDPTSNLAYNTSYTCTVSTAAQDLAGNSIAIQYQWSFTTIVEAPAQVTYTSPTNGQTGVSITASLNWSAAARATSYDVYFGTTSPGAFIGNQSGTSYAPPGNLSNNTTYYWRIDSKNAGGTTTGIVWSFTTIVAAPAQVTTPTPSTGATGIPITWQLSWASASNATSYDVYFGTTSPGTFRGNQTATIYNPGTLLNNTVYFWRIDSKNSVGTTPGIVWNFTTIVAPPDQVTSPNPGNGETNVPITQQLSWAAASGATSYNVYFGTTSPGTLQTNTAGTSYDPGTLLNNTVYFWRINSKNAGGTTIGIVWNFTTQIPPPPTVTTNPATAITYNSAVLNGNVNPNGLATTAYFQWGQTTSYGNTTTAQAIGSGTSNVVVSANISGLSSNTVYNFRCVATNAGGTTYGTNRAFGYWLQTTFPLGTGVFVNTVPANANNDVTLSLTQNWFKRLPATLPLARTDHAMAYDSVRQRTVLFGGCDSVSLSDTWEWNGTNWILRASGTPPAQDGHAMVYDSVRQKTVLFGGSGWGNGTWEWNGTSWGLHFDTAPSARCWHAMAYDLLRQKTVLFGGFTGTGFSNETWEWNGINWTRRSPVTLPSPRDRHAMVYDSVRQRIVLFGGITDTDWYNNETWEWDGTNWTRLYPTTSPPGRQAHAMAYDSVRQRTILFGGITTGGVFSNETWEWNGINWTQQSPVTSPSGQGGHAMVYDSVRQRTVLFGGRTAVALSNETWEWGSSYVSSGTYVSESIIPTSVSSWGLLNFTRTLPANTTFTVDVLRASDNVLLLSNVLSGNSISSIGSVPGIKLRANFSTTNTAVAPTLSDWGVGWAD